MTLAVKVALNPNTNNQPIILRFYDMFGCVGFDLIIGTDKELIDTDLRLVENVHIRLANIYSEGPCIFANAVNTDTDILFRLVHVHRLLHIQLQT